MSFTALYESLVSVSVPTILTTLHEEATLLMEEAEEGEDIVETAQEEVASTSSDVPPDVTGTWNELPQPITVQGVELNPYTTVATSNDDDKPLYRNGHGVRTVRAPFGYNLHVYVVAMYTKVPIRSEQDVQDLLLANDSVFVMEFTFLRDITPTQMSIAWNYQLDTSVTDSDYEGYADDRAKFLELLGDGPMAERESSDSTFPQIKWY
ncbi:expressed unknown protein [Seminavis robusta]|uniref:Uncharacterized protein n=1 Tax=Seminavis robusta TaxID=568900 RepID=A0A9N8EJZ7_9STRA|nr:expressed unknown protein [Seminavis robusta]|eukprot:Sro1124_g243810.1 n/a (208) ;mRNA; r:17990-18613